MRRWYRAPDGSWEAREVPGRIWEAEHLPAAPLLQLVAVRGGPSVCGAIKHTELERAYYRAQHDGWVTVRQADELAIRMLGLHPLLVWGDRWLESA